MRPIRCSCGFIWQRKALTTAIDTGKSLICPVASCRRELTPEEIEEFLGRIGELTYEETPPELR